MNKQHMEKIEKDIRAAADKDIESKVKAMEKDIKLKMKAMKSALILEEKVRKSFQDLAARMRKVKNNRWITDTYGISSAMLSRFKKEPHLGMSHINYLRLMEAVSTLEKKKNE